MRSALRSTKNWAKGYGEAEVLVRDCTCNEDGPPDPRTLRQLSNLTLRNLQTYKAVWTLLWNRTKHFQYIRHVQRGMQTMEYLLIHGNERIIQDVADNLLTIKRLTTYKYYKDGSREVASDVREQAKRLIQLMEDVDALTRQREEATQNRPKMGAITGFGSESVKHHSADSEPQVKGSDIQTVHKWQDSPTTPPAASNDEPGAAEDPAKKKKKKKKKKKNKEGSGEADAANDFGEDFGEDFDAFRDIDFGEMPQTTSEPVVVEALAAPQKRGKVKKKAAVTPVKADVLGFGMQPGAPPGATSGDMAPPSGKFSFGEGDDDWVSSLTANQPENNNNLFDDMFSAPATHPKNKVDDIFGGFAAAKPTQPAPEPVSNKKKEDPLYQGFVNTDDIFGSAPKKRQPKAAPGKKTISQLQAEKQLNNSFGTQSTPTQQSNIFMQMNQPDPFAPAAPVQQNPFGFNAPTQPNPFGPTQPNPFGAPPPQQNPFGLAPQPSGVAVQPQWGAQPLYQPPLQQQQPNPFDKIGGWS